MDPTFRAFLIHKKLDTILIPSSKNKEYSDLSSIVEVYTTEGYSCMTGDHIRNKAYQSGIKAVLEQCKEEFKYPIHITEIGPGADACLLKMCLSAITPTTTNTATDVPIYYIGIEGNKQSAKKCEKQLKSILDNIPKHSYFLVKHSMSTDIENISIYNQTDILLHELIGFIASREGMIRIFYDIQCKRKLQNLPPLMIPSTMATLFVPTFIDETSLRIPIKSFNKGVRFIHGYDDNFLLIQPFPFDSKSINPFWPQCGLLEFFELNQLTKLDLSNEMKYKSEFKNNSEISISVNSITCFIHVGFETPNSILRRIIKTNIKTNINNSKPNDHPNNNHYDNNHNQYHNNNQNHEIQTITIHNYPEITNKIKSKHTFFTTCNLLPPFSFGWTNIVLCFKPITLQPNESLIVETNTSFQDGDIPIYSFMIWNDNINNNINNNNDSQNNDNNDNDNEYNDIKQKGKKSKNKSKDKNAHQNAHQNTHQNGHQLIVLN